MLARHWLHVLWVLIPCMLLQAEEALGDIGLGSLHEGTDAAWRKFRGLVKVVQKALKLQRCVGSGLARSDSLNCVCVSITVDAPPDTSKCMRAAC